VSAPPSREATAGGRTVSTVSEERRGRRPYRAPTLRHLGSVRELTLGGTFGVVEGAGTFAMRM
jgi:hypothetical protein